MPKKLTYEFVKSQFEKNGYKLLSKIYTDSKSKLDYTCSYGHNHSITYNALLNGVRCPYCTNRAKLTIELITQDFGKEYYTVLDNCYINNKTKIKYRCPNGHEHSISWNEWQSGNRCPYCANKAKKTIEDIGIFFAKNGYFLLSTVYINSNTKLDYICPEGHKHNITWRDFNSGYRCPYCSGNAKPTIEFIKSVFVKEGYTVLDDIYIDSRNKINYICHNDHQHSISWNSWLRGVRCFYCYGTPILTIAFVKSEFAKESYTLLEEAYVNNSTKMNYLCPNGHEHAITWNDWQQGARCPKCSNNGTSKFEQEVKDFLINLGQDIIENDRSLINNPNTDHMLELDILFPCKTKAIECNGVYWHNRPEVKVRDEIKQDQCKEKGIKLLTITDESWYNDREKCEKIIKDFMNL